MHVFSKYCFCRSLLIPFRSSERFDEHAIARVFCPICADRAPGEGFLVVVEGIPGWSGPYAIDWNQSFLEEKDSSFKDTERYYKTLFSRGDITFGFLPKRKMEESVTILGIKERLPSEIVPSGRAGKVLDEAQEVSAVPMRRTKRGTRDAKKKPRGLKKK